MDAGEQGGDELTLMKEIYTLLTQRYGLKLDTQDNLGRTTLHIAASHKNLAFIELAFKDLEKLDKAKALKILNIQERQT